MLPFLTLVGLAPLVVTQQIFIPADGPALRPQCPNKASPYRQPQYTLTPFSHTLTDTVRYATSVPPATTTETYAAPLESLTTLLPTLSYTTWGKWDPQATAVVANDSDDPFGQTAWTALWEYANPPNFTRETSVFSTTVSPTPIPSSELVLPPKDYFGPQDCYFFPKGFRFGVSGSASQIEGATADEGKAPTLMDILVQDDRPKPYVTDENYYYYKQDIERLAAMGVKRYAFSISWARILPFALPGTPVNQEGIDHYNDLINFILEKGMVPEVTLLHFDTPLQFYGNNLTQATELPFYGSANGAYNNETFPGAFVHYAKTVMAHYADRVPVWYTFNEPILYSLNGKSVYNIIKSHADVYHFYKEVLEGTGQVSLRLNNNFGVPRDPNNDMDIYITEGINSLILGSFANPIFLGTDYPDSFKQAVPDYVPLTRKDLDYMNGTADFFAMNHYTAVVVAAAFHGDLPGIQTTNVNRFGWNIGYRSQSFAYTTPTYFRSYLNYVWNTWRHPIIITEFGFPVFGETEKELPDQLYDSPRSIYYLSFLSELLKATWEDGVHVAGATAWSFVDNWEFGDGEANFGIQAVNRTTKQRYYKKSFFDVVDFMRTRGA